MWLCLWLCQWLASQKDFLIKKISQSMFGVGDVDNNGSDDHATITMLNSADLLNLDYNNGDINRCWTSS